MGFLSADLSRFGLDAAFLFFNESPCPSRGEYTVDATWHPHHGRGATGAGSCQALTAPRARPQARRAQRRGGLSRKIRSHRSMWRERCMGTACPDTYTSIPTLI